MHLRVVRLRGGQQGLQAEQRSLESERRAPLVLQDVQADGPVGAAHVGVPHLAAEPHLGRHKGVLVLCAHAKQASSAGGETEFHLCSAACVQRHSTQLHRGSSSHGGLVLCTHAQYPSSASGELMPIFRPLHACSATPLSSTRAALPMGDRSSARTHNILPQPVVNNCSYCVPCMYARHSTQLHMGTSFHGGLVLCAHAVPPQSLCFASMVSSAPVTAPSCLPGGSCCAPSMISFACTNSSRTYHTSALLSTSPSLSGRWADMSMCALHMGTLSGLIPALQARYSVK